MTKFWPLGCEQKWHMQLPQNGLKQKGLPNLFFFLLAEMWKWWQESQQPGTMKWKPSLKYDRTIRQPKSLIPSWRTATIPADTFISDGNFWHEVINNIGGGGSSTLVDKSISQLISMITKQWNCVFCSIKIITKVYIQRTALPSHLEFTGAAEGSPERTNILHYESGPKMVVLRLVMHLTHWIWPNGCDHFPKI